MNAQFEYAEDEGLQVVEEFSGEGSAQTRESNTQSTAALSNKLAGKQTAG